MIRSPIKWVGGKYKLRKKLISMLPPHQCYVEVFAGAAWVLFGKEPSEYEVLNDIHPEVVNFFKVVKAKPEELISSFRWDLASREEFERLLDLDPQSLDPVDRAHRFFYLVMAGWGGELHRARFQTSISDGGHGNRLIGALKRLENRILLANRRLQNVTIEQQDWCACVDQYDDENTVMYLDPPYPNNNCNYEYNMRSLELHEKIAERMRRVKAKFLLTTYDRPEVTSLFAGFETLHVEFASGMPSENGRKNEEIIVTNYDPADTRLQMEGNTAARIKREVTTLLQARRKSCRAAGKLEELAGAEQNSLDLIILSIMPEHDCYVEVFAHEEIALFGKPPSLVEVLNDIDGKMMNLFRTVRKNQQSGVVPSNLSLEVVERGRNITPGWLTEIVHMHDASPMTQSGEFLNLPAIKTLDAVHDRLQTVIVERLPWESCMERYDDERTVMYLNLRTHRDEGQQFLGELAQRMRRGKARLILATCERPELQRVFSGLCIMQIQKSDGASEEYNRQYQEYIITNFDLGEGRQDDRDQEMKQVSTR